MIQSEKQLSETENAKVRPRHGTDHAVGKVVVRLLAYYAFLINALEQVNWVTPVMAFNPKTSALATYGKPFWNMSYRDICVVVYIAKAGRSKGRRLYYA